jgi:dienelactone hydrolase
MARIRLGAGRFRALYPAAFALSLALGGCQTTADPSGRPVTTGPRLDGAISVAVPPGAVKAPVVLLLEGNGGSTRVPEHWSDFFTRRGIAVAQIHSARARGRANWAGTACGLQYNTDARAALEVLRDRPEIDVTRFAIMGFSRGGTEALNSGSAFAADAVLPAAVFSFYPGCSGFCATDWPRRSAAVPVTIFYGAADMWGTQDGNRGSCRRQAGGSVTYHEFPGAHHGFDAPWRGSFGAGGGVFRFEPDPAARAASDEIILDVLAKAWGTPK